MPARLVRGWSHAKFRTVWLEKHIVAPTRNVLVTSGPRRRKSKIKDLPAITTETSCSREVGEERF
jgi:hypothetical protein